MEGFMRSAVVKVISILLSVLMFAVLAGCQKPVKEAGHLPSSQSEPPAAITNEGVGGSPAISQDIPPQKKSNPLPVPLDNGDYDTTETTIPAEEQDSTLSSEAESDESRQDHDSADPKEQEANVSSNPEPQQEDFDRNRLTLIGIKLGDKRDQVGKKLGKPVDEYTMDDESGSVIVYEYSGYSVGFDSRGRVLFVEVSSSRTATGLNGLRIGHTDEDAIQALGKPDSSTSYVLSYTSGGHLLKLDLDPKTRAIQSIKLFSSE